jgi:IS30 family transposase
MISSLLVFPEKLRRTITLDNGSENAAHSRVDSIIKTTTYFCHPYCASERGSVENANGFLRKFLPKKTDFKQVSKEDILRVQNIHNHRPMKCLGYKTPYEVFSLALKSAAA